MAKSYKKPIVKEPAILRKVNSTPFSVLKRSATLVIKEIRHTKKITINIGENRVFNIFFNIFIMQYSLIIFTI